MKILIFSLICVVFLFFYVKLIEKNSIFFPSKLIEFNPESIKLGYEDVYFYSSDSQRLFGWFIPSSQHKFVILFFHGNAGNISHRLEKITIFYNLGLDTFIIDYRGYGRSSGKPSELGIYLDAQAAYDYLIKEKHIASEKIVLYGESLGAQAAVDLASKNKVGALILEGCFTSAKDISRTLYPILPTVFLSVHFDAKAKIAKIPYPKLIINTRDDEIVPFRLGQELFAASPEPKMFLELSGGHNSAFLDSGDKFSEKIKEFLNQI
jgi:fermentation-respiration switch protein FrsA (DUF1100 family)